MPNGIQYQILRADKEGMPSVDGEIYTDPEQAAGIAKALSRKIGEKLMVKPIINNEWQKRETQRIKDGTYRRLPWDTMDWWQCGVSRGIWKDQFPHPSIERPGYLAYTKCAEDGMKDKQTIVRPGAYLKKYFERTIERYGVSERHLVELFMQAFGPLEVKFATTEDEMISVYENGPNTCMMGKNWPGDGRNPAYIYAAGDLQVAYLGDLENASARTLVWPEKKIFSRVYGDIARLTRGLERMGYRWGAPIGAKLKRVERKKVRFDPNEGAPTGCFIAPYIDKKNQAGGGHLSILDKGDHLIICEEGNPGSHHCGMAEGISGIYVPKEDEYPTFTCEFCGTPGFRELHNVYTDEQAENEVQWCAGCCKRHTFHCQYSGNRFSTGDVEMVRIEGDPWNKYYADMYTIHCQMDGCRYSENNMRQVHFPDKPTMWINIYWLNDRGGVFQSAVSGRWYMNTERVVMRFRGIGKYVAKSELKHHAFQCDGCDCWSSISDRNQTKDDDRLFCGNCHERIEIYKKIPVSQTRKAFEANRQQLNLIAAE